MFDVYNVVNGNVQVLLVEEKRVNVIIAKVIISELKQVKEL